MTSEPKSIRVVATPHFNHSFKRLRKKYRRIENDLRSLIAQLEQGETPGDQVQGTRFTLYKARVASSDAQRGKSGGYRVIYYLNTATFIFLVELYPKSERTDIRADELRRLITEIEAEADDTTP
jgi:mRNA-degrading endonuclease RelE of RelBE toxin-antitoxin system